jgi:hypothetical protein
MQGLLAHSISYRIALGPRAGRKVFTLQRLRAGVAARANARKRSSGCAGTSAAQRCRRRACR